ncbi:MAG: hypothetical protein PHV53_06925 [Fermentimonas sp.]|nr:hypothetical protein [Fermentimonas sp.]
MKRYFLIAFLFLFSCVDNSPRLTIPFAPVKFTIDLNAFDHSLREGLSYKIFTEPRLSTDRLGYAGLLAVTDATGSNIYVYDLCCPYEDDRNIRITPRGDGKAECPGCNSVFITMYGQSGLGFGTPERGPSKEPLQSYHVYSSRPGVYEVINTYRGNK